MLMTRDIKDENMLVNLKTGNLAIIDFGSGCHANQDPLREFEGRCTVQAPSHIICLKIYSDNFIAKVCLVTVPTSRLGLRPTDFCLFFLGAGGGRMMMLVVKMAMTKITKMMMMVIGQLVRHPPVCPS